MDKIRIVPLISERRIRRKVKELAAQISTDLAGREVLMIGILKGSFVFMADLMRGMDARVECEFVRASSYAGTQSSGKVMFEFGKSSSLRGKNVLLVEDIVDTGRTLYALRRYIENSKPRSLRICCLLDKHERREVAIKIDYVGFRIPNRFVVGYGLDCNEQLRNLPYVGYVEEA